jgi:hypothetical protein
MNMAVFCDVAPCGLKNIDRLFKEGYCLHQQLHYTRLQRGLITGEEWKMDDVWNETVSAIRNREDIFVNY